MPRFYDPKTGTEALEGINDLKGCTSSDDMPESSRAWFDRPARDGKQWKTDPTGKFPVEVDIPPPTTDQLKETERAWSAQELAATDPVMLSDSPYSDEQRDAVRTYRSALRNPAREANSAYPDPLFWRPEWPKGVKRPGE